MKSGGREDIVPTARPLKAFGEAAMKSSSSVGQRFNKALKEMFFGTLCDKEADINIAGRIPATLSSAMAGLSAVCARPPSVTQGWQTPARLSSVTIVRSIDSHREYLLIRRTLLKWVIPDVLIAGRELESSCSSTSQVK